MKIRYMMILALMTNLIFLAPAVSYGLSYQEKKDLNALGVIERALKRTPVQTGIFDGNKIKPGTQATQVRLYLDQVQTQIRTAQSAWRGVSSKSRSSLKGIQLEKQFNEYQDYATKLAKAFKVFSDNQPLPDARRNQPVHLTASSTQQEIKLASVQAKKKELQETCRNFRKLVQPQDKSALKTLAMVAQGQDFHVQDLQELKRYRDTISKVSSVCTKPEFKNIQEACQAMTSFGTAKEGSYCHAVSNGEKLLVQMVKNYAIFLDQQQGSASDISPDSLKQQNGWVKLEGAVNWSTLTSGGGNSDVIYKRLKPLYNEVGLSDIKEAKAFSNINSKASKLASIVKELAPTWRTPGKTCSGDACDVAEKTIQAWYPRGKVFKTHQKQSTWKIRQHNITKQPIERYRSGWTLIQVPDDPLCQLRSWTVYEKYKGGGQYQEGDSANIGYVRWQKCSS